MRLLLLQFTSPTETDPAPRFCPYLGVLASLLQQQGHTLTLAALPGFAPHRIREAIISDRPEYLLVELTPFSLTAARRTVVDIAEKYKLPVVALGPAATARPGPSLSQPGVEAVFVGEYEVTAVEYFRAVEQGESPSGIPGAWVRDDQRAAKGPPRPPVQGLEVLPFPDRELFQYARHVDRTGEADVQVSRGCPRWCAHCLNDWFLELYEEFGHTVRRRSPQNVLEEIARLLEEYDGIHRLRLTGHSAVTDEPWLAEFVEAYRRKHSLPWRAHLPLAAVTPEVARLLAEGGCTRVHTHLGSGNRFIRQEVLAMKVSDAEVVRATGLLRAAGMKVAATVFVGCPYETEITLEHTVTLATQAGFDRVEGKVFYPAPGTRAAEVCRENGWLTGRGEECYWSGRSVLNMPALSAGQIEAVAEKFPSLLKRSGAAKLRKLLARHSG